MRRLSALFFLVLLFGCQQEMPPSAAAISTSEAEELIEAYTTALLECDIEKYRSLFHSEADIFSAAGSEAISAEQLVQNVEEQCAQGVKIDLDAQSIQIRSLGDVVVATFIVRGSRSTDTGETEDINGRFSLVITQDNDRAVIFHGHVSGA